MRRRSTGAWLATAVLVAAGVAGCGSSSGSGAKGSAGTGSGAENASTSHESGAGAPAAGRYSYGPTSTSSQASSANASSGGTMVTSKSLNGLGKVLATGPKQLTLYVFLADTAGKSNCNGTCAAIWPPVEAKGALQGASGVSASALGTITRSNGAKQVTYHGHPLYYYTADHTAKEALGEGVSSFGAKWYAISPTGSEVTKG